MLCYLERWIAQGLPPYRMVRHLLSLFACQRAARLWKRSLSERTWVPETAVAALREAMGLIPDAVLDACPQTAEHGLSTSWLSPTVYEPSQQP
jgi:hypothetical protein